MALGRRARWAAPLAAAAVLAACGSGGAPRTLSPLSAGRVPPGEFGRNVARVGGLSPADVAGAALLATFSARDRPSGWILTPDDDWRGTVLAAQFAAGPVYAGVLPVKRSYLPPAAADVMARIRPASFARADGLQALVIGRATRDLFGDVAELDLKLSQLDAASADRLALAMVPYWGGFAGRYSRSIAIVAADAPDYALPVAAWSAYSGDTVAFVDRHGVPPATRRLLVQRRKLLLERPSIYVAGPPSVVSVRTLRELAAYGPVKRIGGATPAAAAVALARYHDPATGFGWGLRRGPASVTLADRRDPGNAVAALALAARGPRAPLLLVDDPDSLPAATADYLGGLGRPSQAFALGDARSISSPLLARVEAILEEGAGAGA